jgi:peptide deformylase
MIITNNEAALRVSCQDVLTEEVGELVSMLEAELQNANRLGMRGIGLAAPQIGIAKKIAIVRLGGEHNLNLVNCRIEQGYDPAMFRSEGCLSFPGRVEDTTRFQEIHVINNLDEPHKFVATGLLSVVCQHEIDHLNATLFIDRMISKPPEMSKVGRNDLCPCGSQRKFKKCCG